MSMKFDTSECYFNPSRFGGDTKIQDVYPESSAYTEFLSPEEDIKIAILLSDFKSPFLKIKDHKQKVQMIFKFLGINTKTGRYKKVLEDIEDFRDRSIYPLCAIYIQIQNNEEFSYWWNLSQLYYELMAEMGRPREQGESLDRNVNMKLKIQKQADEIKETLSDCSVNLFGTSEMKMAVARAKLEKTRTYPEMHAEQAEGAE